MITLTAIGHKQRRNRHYRRVWPVAPTSGIGTTSPGSLLDVVTSASGSTSILRLGVPNAVGNNASIDFMAGAFNLAKISSQYSAANNIGLSFSTYNGSLGERVRIDAAGNVGIGTTNPTQTFVVNGAGNITSLGVGAVADSNAGALRVSVNNSTTPAIRTDQSGTGPTAVFMGGNVGIGTTNATAKLEVNGGLKFTGDTRPITKAPRVVYLPDTRSGGCPPALAANTDIQSYTFTLASAADVKVEVDTITNYTSRVDHNLLVDGTIVRYHLTASANMSWQPVHLAWAGSLAAGSHTVSYRATAATVTGCGSGWGGMILTIFE